MASGFIILKDGRCLAKRWSIFDYIIELVIEELLNEQCKEAIEFKEWLQTLIPNENDEYNGYGGHTRLNWEEKFARGGVGAIISSYTPVAVRGRILTRYAMIDNDDKIPF